MPPTRTEMLPTAGYCHCRANKNEIKCMYFFALLCAMVAQSSRYGFVVLTGSGAPFWRLGNSWAPSAVAYYVLRIAGDVVLSNDNELCIITPVALVQVGSFGYFINISAV
jgi:hypothetical protein